MFRCDDDGAGNGFALGDDNTDGATVVDGAAVCDSASRGDDRNAVGPSGSGSGGGSPCDATVNDGFDNSEDDAAGGVDIGSRLSVDDAASAGDDDCAPLLF